MIVPIYTYLFIFDHWKNNLFLWHLSLVHAVLNILLHFNVILTLLGMSFMLKKNWSAILLSPKNAKLLFILKVDLKLFKNDFKRRESFSFWEKYFFWLSFYLICWKWWKSLICDLTPQEPIAQYMLETWWLMWCHHLGCRKNILSLNFFFFKLRLDLPIHICF